MPAPTVVRVPGPWRAGGPFGQRVLRGNRIRPHSVRRCHGPERDVPGAVAAGVQTPAGVRAVILCSSGKTFSPKSLMLDSTLS